MGYSNTNYFYSAGCSITELLGSNRLHNLVASIFNMILYSSQSKEQYVQNYNELSPDYKIDFWKPSTGH